MVHVYIANVRDLPDPKEYPGIMGGLSEERKKKILRYRRDMDRKQSLGAGLLLYHVLKEHGFDAGKMSYGPHGKPEINGIYFNLSHSYDYVMCAVSDRIVGCDIEKTEKIRENIAEHFFTENEVRYLNTFEEKARLDEFYRMWTLKESYMKMTGEGMSLPLKAFDIQIGESIQIYREGKRCDCFIKEYEIAGYKVSVCAEEAVFEKEIEEIMLASVFPESMREYDFGVDEK